MGTSTISMAIFHCYVSLPEGIYNSPTFSSDESPTKIAGTDAKAPRRVDELHRFVVVAQDHCEFQLPIGWHLTRRPSDQWFLLGPQLIGGYENPYPEDPWCWNIYLLIGIIWKIT